MILEIAIKYLPLPYSHVYCKPVQHLNHCDCPPKFYHYEIIKFDALFYTALSIKLHFNEFYLLSDRLLCGTMITLSEAASITR